MNTYAYRPTAAMLLRLRMLPLPAASVVKLNGDKGLAVAAVSSCQDPATAGNRIMFAVQHGIGRTSLQDAAHRRPCMGLCVVFL
jgi:hypothetical protein